MHVSTSVERYTPKELTIFGRSSSEPCAEHTVAVEPFHLDRYLNEQVFRFNNRATKDNPLNDSDRFTFLMSQVAGKRLTYAQLTGKAVDALHHPAAGTGQEEPF